jgi:hypothetical protein
MTAAVIPATAVLTDGSAVLSPGDLLTVLDALADAAKLRLERGAAACLECISAPARCRWHREDADQAAAYAAAAARLGDYR